MTTPKHYTDDHMENVAAISHCLFAQRKRYDAFMQEHSDSYSGCKGVYGVICDAAVTLETVVKRYGGWDEFDWYITSDAVADYILTEAPHRMTEEEMVQCLRK